MTRPEIIDPREPMFLRPIDLLGAVTLFFALEFLVPARLVIGGLGAAGRPSAVVGLGLLIVWLASWARSNGGVPGRQPVRWILAAYVLSGVLSYAAGDARGLLPLEARAADRWLILTAAMCGLALALADGIRSRKVLDTVLRRLTYFVGAVAALGVLQSVTDLDYATMIDLPGLQPNGELRSVETRGDGGFTRIAGTAVHYIEFGVVLAVVTPLALHLAVFAHSRRQRQVRWALVALIATGVPLSVSRAGMLALIVGFAVMAFVWTGRFRIRALVVAVFAAIVFSIIKPGLLGTIRSLFTNAEDDPSVQGRLEDYESSEEYISENPLWGRGPATFNPDIYFFLDNEYLYSAITRGLVGLAALIAIFGGGYLMARSVRLRGADERTRHLGQAFAASFVAAFVSAGTFDALSFPMFTALLFLLLGLVGALWRLDRPASRRGLQRAAAGDRVVATPWAARWPVRDAG